MRDRSMAMVVRNGSILMIQTLRHNRYIWELPGGGIEPDETPEETAVRELKEESDLNGEIIRPLNTIHCKDGSTEYVFLTKVSEDQTPVVGSDPEIPDGKEQSIKKIAWKQLPELCERDRAFLWSCGLMEVEGFCDIVWTLGD